MRLLRCATCLSPSTEQSSSDHHCTNHTQPGSLQDAVTMLNEGLHHSKYRTEVRSQGPYWTEQSLKALHGSSCPWV